MRSRNFQEHGRLLQMHAVWSRYLLTNHRRNLQPYLSQLPSLLNDKWEQWKVRVLMQCGISRRVRKSAQQRRRGIGLYAFPCRVEDPAAVLDELYTVRALQTW
jgi:hypothetical protein